ncbi:MAG: hypothetical protein AVDCRST_MAG57-3381, partial [uncultured Blastococcus sp.]
GCARLRWLDVEQRYPHHPGGVRQPRRVERV